MTISSDQYEILITSEYRGKPKFTATIDTTVQPYVDGQNQVNLLYLLFDLDLAVGAQLDAVGVRVGRNRFVSTPITGVYFAWDTVNLGWDQGYWQGQFDPSEGVVALDDDTYRLLLRSVIIANSWDGTVAGAAQSLLELFNGTTTPGTRVFIEDHFDMTMTIAIAGTIPPAIFLGILAQGDIRLKPVGVGSNYIMTSITDTPIFGFDIESDLVSGWDVGSWGIPVPV